MGTELPPWRTAGGRVALAMARVPKPWPEGARSLDTQGLYTEREFGPLLPSGSSGSTGNATRCRGGSGHPVSMPVSHAAWPLTGWGPAGMLEPEVACGEPGPGTDGGWGVDGGGGDTGGSVRGGGIGGSPRGGGGGGPKGGGDAGGGGGSCPRGTGPACRRSAAPMRVATRSVRVV